MSFTLDNRNSASLSANSRSANASFTADTMTLIRPSWGSDINTWAQETHTWAQMVSSFNAISRN